MRINSNLSKSILFHLLILLLFFIHFQWDKEPLFEKKSNRYLPAYLHQESKLPVMNLNEKNFAKSSESQQPVSLAEKGIILKKNLHPQNVISHHAKNPAQAFIEAESLKTGKPVDDQLLKELTRATAKTLFYPAKAAVFHLKGTSSVGFYIQPNGNVTDVQLVQSSGFKILDDAAVNAIKAISPVRDVNLYLSKPKFVVAGIIFG